MSVLLAYNATMPVGVKRRIDRCRCIETPCSTANEWQLRPRCPMYWPPLLLQEMKNGTPSPLFLRCLCLHGIRPHGLSLLPNHSNHILQITVGLSSTLTSIDPFGVTTDSKVPTANWVIHSFFAAWSTAITLISIIIGQPTIMESKLAPSTFKRRRCEENLVIVHYLEPTLFSFMILISKLCTRLVSFLYSFDSFSLGVRWLIDTLRGTSKLQYQWSRNHNHKPNRCLTTILDW